MHYPMPSSKELYGIDGIRKLFKAWAGAAVVGRQADFYNLYFRRTIQELR